MLKHIHATNFKSFRELDLEFTENILCCLGKNGSGKTSLFYLISYFFQHLGDLFSTESIIDNSNPYIQESSIAVDLSVGWLTQYYGMNSELNERINYIRKKYSNNPRLPNNKT